MNNIPLHFYPHKTLVQKNITFESNISSIFTYILVKLMKRKYLIKNAVNKILRWTRKIEA